MSRLVLNIEMGFTLNTKDNKAAISKKMTADYIEKFMLGNIEKLMDDVAGIYSTTGETAIKK